MEDRFVCQFHDFSHDGLGVGKIGSKVVFVDGVLPQEVAAIKITKEKKNYLEGHLLQIQQKSPDRIEPICPKFGSCGGCQVMHLKYEKQTYFKKNRVINQINKMMKTPIDFEIDIMPSESDLYYRNKIELKIEKGKIGYYEKKSHKLLDISKCFIAKSILNKILTSLRSFISNLDAVYKVTLRTNRAENEVTLIFHSDEKFNHNWINELISIHPEIVGVVLLSSHFKKEVIFGRSYLNENVLNETFKVDCLAFLQVNIPQAEKLYQKVIEFLNPKKEEVIVDAYCGIGILACLLAKTQAKVLGLDIIKESILSAQENAQFLKLDNAQFTQEPFEKSKSLQGNIDSLIINPPRGGCDPLAFSKVRELSPSKIIYVSCDPATLSRDLNILFSCDYKIKQGQIFDLFPQTMHVETVIYLEKID